MNELLETHKMLRIIEIGDEKCWKVDRLFGEWEVDPNDKSQAAGESYQGLERLHR
jgi:hypothetical protein